MKKYSAVIIGGGNIAGSHAQGYAAIDEIDIVAVADPDRDKAAGFSKQFGIRSVYGDYRDMLDKERPDIVSICTWHPFHAEMTVAAASRKPQVILCEKPMATSIGEAEEMIIACDRNEVKLAVGFQRRFLSAWTKARELILGGDIGQPVRLSHVRNTGLLNATSHGLDCMRYLLGDPDVEWVFGQVERKTDRYERDIRCEDCVGGFLRFSDGVQGSFQTDLLPDDDQTWAVAQGCQGIVEFDDNSVRFFNEHTHGWKDIKIDPIDPFEAQARELVMWLDGEREHRNRAENGMWTMQMMMGVYESARRREKVHLPMQTRANPLDLMVESGELAIERPGRYDTRSFLLGGEAMSLDDTAA